MEVGDRTFFIFNVTCQNVTFSRLRGEGGSKPLHCDPVAAEGGAGNALQAHREGGQGRRLSIILGGRGGRNHSEVSS